MRVYAESNFVLELVLSQEVENRFLDVRTRLVGVARMIAIDESVLRDAAGLVALYDLELPDAVMLASVLADAIAWQSPSVFLNRNTRDFDDPDIKHGLEQVGCDLILSFDDALARVTSMLARDTH
jgi:hypothetical protein